MRSDRLTFMATTARSEYGESNYADFPMDGTCLRVAEMVADGIDNNTVGGQGSYADKHTRICFKNCRGLNFTDSLNKKC